MFYTKNVVGITKYLLLSVLTLSSECLAAARDDYVNHIPTRRPLLDTEPTYTPLLSDYPPDENDVTIFFVIFIVGIIIIALLSYYCHKAKSSSSGSSSNGIRPRVSGAVIHPPPRNHGTLTPPVMPTAPVYRGTTDNPMVSFVNNGYQTDRSVTGGAKLRDVPPDYSSVALGDLTTQGVSRFPTVKKMETPPPQYQDGQPFH